jgi:hypothetical protein
MRRLGLRARRHGFTLWNLPPASVYVFTRDGESGLAPSRQRGLPRSSRAAS